MVPECVGGGVHEEEASVSQLQLHGLDLSPGRFPSSVSVPEDKVTRCPQGDGGNGANGVQLPFIIAVLTHVIQAVFVPGGEEEN